jgi:hypothetical protein
VKPAAGDAIGSDNILPLLALYALIKLLYSSPYTAHISRTQNHAVIQPIYV